MFAVIWNFLFHVCKHEWKTVNRFPVHRHGVCSVYTLRCENCGNLKRVEV